MASRQVISYDDITLPYEPSEQPHPPQKKRKRNTNNNASHKKIQHWDDPELASELDEDESRELTHGEIWDDSALIEAWNAAMEEYDAFHGPDKGWKKQPIHKSPLWYNIPPENVSKQSTQTRPPTDIDSPNQTDSQPLDFESFVPTHDPGLSGAATSATAEEDGQETNYAVPLNRFSNISQDGAFERAIQASYWSGYWTAVYYSHRQNQTIHDNDTPDAEEEETEDFVSTQR